MIGFWGACFAGRTSCKNEQEFWGAAGITLDDDAVHK
jgi:hypothetical protein